MAANPFDVWRAGRAFGDFRLAELSEHNVYAAPVVRVTGHQSVFANGFFVWSQRIGDQPRIQIAFDNHTKIREVEFVRSDVGIDQSRNLDLDVPVPPTGIVRHVVQELCSIDMTASTAAELVQALLKRLSEHAPEALEAVGIRVKRDGDE
jgi:hypothetical protein